MDECLIRLKFYGKLSLSRSKSQNTVFSRIKFEENGVLQNSLLVGQIIVFMAHWAIC